MGLMLLSMGLVSANWVMPEMPGAIKTIEEPVFPDMPEQTYIDGLTGNLVDTHYAMGGWYYDGGWALEDFQHTTAKITSAACTTGVESYLDNYMDSGTEASGTAWQFSSMSLLNAEGGSHDINNEVLAWTVNPVGPGEKYTKVFFEEFTGKLDSNMVTHSLVVEGDATGNAGNPLIIKTHYESDDDTFQQKAVGVNIN